VAPTPRWAARCIAGPMATALTIKSVKVMSSKSAPRWTLPGFGEVASNKQANVAQEPMDKSVSPADGFGRGMT